MILYVAPVLVPTARATSSDDRLDLLVSDPNFISMHAFVF